jgi:hypothetical protein
MTYYPYFGFQQSPQQRRLVGARGGRACARNRRLRLGLTHPLPESVGLVPAPPETTAQAIAALDAQFPWLRGAEKRGPAPFRRFGDVKQSGSFFQKRGKRPEADLFKSGLETR